MPLKYQDELSRLIANRVIIWFTIHRTVLIRIFRILKFTKICKGACLNLKHTSQKKATLKMRWMKSNRVWVEIMKWFRVKIQTYFREEIRILIIITTIKINMGRMITDIIIMEHMDMGTGTDMFIMVLKDTYAIIITTHQDMDIIMV